jgi:transaldolase
MSDALKELSEAGVAVWLDDLSRERLVTGSLATLIRDSHVVGVTTNPTIFQKAIAGSAYYDAQAKDLAIRDLSVGEALRLLTAADVREACDLFRASYDASDGVDGRVSIEVSPMLAHETEQTIAEARSLWWLVDRPNLFIKIPATQQGLAAITTSVARGISVNVTLIFSPERYRAVMDAYLSGLEQRVQDGGSLAGVESVASFFISRVDTEIDRRLDKAGADPSLKGKAALANAQLAYQACQEVFSSDRWRALEAQGAKTQRPLWASTGVKNRDYPDTLYVSDLIAPDTVNTMPEKTLRSYADHGSPGKPIQRTYDEAAQVMKAVADAGVDLDEVFEVLEDEGIQKFTGSWDELTKSVRSELKDKK